MLILCYLVIKNSGLLQWNTDENEFYFLFNRCFVMHPKEILALTIIYPYKSGVSA